MMLTAEEITTIVEQELAKGAAAIRAAVVQRISQIEAARKAVSLDVAGVPDLPPIRPPGA